MNYIKSLDIAIINLGKHAAFDKVIPSKIFEFMAMGIPILGGISGEGKNIILKNNIGICVNQDDIDAMYYEICSLRKNTLKLDQYRKNCVTATSKYNRERLAQEALSFLIKKES